MTANLRTRAVVVELNARGVAVIRQPVEDTPEARAIRRDVVQTCLNERGWVAPTVDLSNSTVAYQ